MAYNEKESGLYLHGINYNTAVLNTLPSKTVQQVANYFGFHPIDYLELDTMEQVRQLSDQIEESGEFQGRPIEGVVIRCKQEDEKEFLFKIKNDHYLLFREYREITKVLLDNNKKDGSIELKRDVKPRCGYEKSIYYVSWVKERILDHPEWFVNYKNNKGIIDVREKFEQFWETADLSQLKGDPVLNVDPLKRKK